MVFWRMDGPGAAARTAEREGDSQPTQAVNYAATDPQTGRKLLIFEDGSRSYFAARLPKRAKLTINRTLAHRRVAY